MSRKKVLIFRVFSENEKVIADEASGRERILLMYIVSCCSTVDYSAEYLASRGIRSLSFHYELDGVPYLDDFGKTVPFSEFYEAMRNGAETKTSQINISEYYDFFKGILEEGFDILHVAFSSGLSGSINSAQNAAAMLSEEFPERTIRIVDSVNASAGHGILADKAADFRDQGLSLSEAADRLEAEKMKAQAWFFTTTLKYFIRGGRISKAAGLIGETLGICPLLTIDSEGKLIPMEKIRTKKKVILAAVDKLAEYAENGTDFAGPCHVCHSDCLEDAQAVISLIESRFPNLVGKIQIHEVGTIIGSHTGPGTVGIFFWGKEKA